MSLPPGFLDELRNRLPLTRVVGRKVTWDLKKSNQAKGDFWAPCPFHQERTASFHVDDRKGFYYCFGCHEKGDAVSFVQKTENASFVEAVEILAREAGMPMPARDPRAAEKVSRSQRLAEVMELAVQHYRLQLSTRAAEGARAYLARRGLSDAAQARWEIGWAGEDRHGLARALKAKGVTDDLLLAAGLTGEGQGGTYDRFWGRIIFPIRDTRGRAIALGGRSLDPNARAKYLNSPQTDLFDKGRSLFNHGPAREACGKGAPLILAEGYMDVIALAEAGFGGAVAPLGTAVTEEQLGLLWRIHPEPVVALDGDAAGLRAAMRVIDLALPRLEAGKGLRFALLPEGQDPDDLLKARGASAMQAVLDEALPMVELLWRRETDGRVFDSPERKAALEKALRGATAAIRDPLVQKNYQREIGDLIWRRVLRPERGGPKGWQPKKGAPAASAAAIASPLAAGSRAPEDEPRRAVLALLFVNPELIRAFAHELEGLDCPDADEAAMRDVLLLHAEGQDLRAAAEAGIGAERLAAILDSAHILKVRRPGDLEAARLDVAEALTRLTLRRTHAAVLEEAIEDFGEFPEERITAQLALVAAAADPTRRKEAEDTRETVVFGNGLSVDKEEKEHRDKVFAQIDPSRGGRGGHRRGP